MDQSGYYLRVPLGEFVDGLVKKRNLGIHGEMAKRLNGKELETEVAALLKHANGASGNMRTKMLLTVAAQIVEEAAYEAAHMQEPPTATRLILLSSDLSALASTLMPREDADMSAAKPATVRYR